MSTGINNVMNPEMRGRKVIYVFASPPTADFEKKFFCHEIQSKGYQIEYWDVSKLFSYDMSNILHNHQIEWDSVQSYPELRKRIGLNRRALVVYVLQITKNLHSFRLYREFSKANARTVYFGRGYLPTFSTEKKSVCHYLEKIRHSSDRLYLTLSKIFSVADKHFHLTKKYDLCFVAGKFARRLHCSDSQTIHEIHHFDFDVAMEESALRPKYLLEDYIVFLDEFLPYHPDLTNKKIVGTGLVDPEKYYKSMNNFFDNVEKITGKNVVIAGHPKSINQPNRYNGRRIFHLKTNELVKHAALVFAHGSTSVSFSVIYKKPLCLITTHEIQEVNPYYVCQLMNRTSEMLGVAIWNVDSRPFIDSDFNVQPSNAYEEYFQEFISDTDLRLTSEKTVCDQLKIFFENWHDH